MVDFKRRRRDDLPTPVFDELVQFLERLQKASIHYALDTIRPNSVLVSVAVPGQRWEVEFLADGSLEAEKFVSDGTIFDKSAVEDLLREFGD
jgi:hypothetical protein